MFHVLFSFVSLTISYLHLDYWALKWYFYQSNCYFWSISDIVHSFWSRKRSFQAHNFVLIEVPIDISSILDDEFHLPFNYSFSIVRSFWNSSGFVMVFITSTNLSSTRELFTLTICLLCFSKLSICQGMLLLIQWQFIFLKGHWETFLN